MINRRENLKSINGKTIMVRGSEQTTKERKQCIGNNHGLQLILKRLKCVIPVQELLRDLDNISKNGRNII